MKRQRFRAGSEESKAFTAIPVWYVLAHAGTEGMGLKQLSHHIEVSPDTIKRKLRYLQKRGIIAQGRCGRWFALIRLSPDVIDYDKVAGLVNKKPTETQKVKAQEAAWASLQPGYEPEPVPAPPEPTLSRVAALAKRFDVPEVISRYGDVNLGRVGKCVTCESNTPLRYGTTSVCTKCAKGGTDGGETATRQGS